MIPLSENTFGIPYNQRSCSRTGPKVHLVADPGDGVPGSARVLRKVSAQSAFWLNAYHPLWPSILREGNYPENQAIPGIGRGMT
jgi:hypothetical protein